MLSASTRRRLHDIGWTEIHQSEIRKAARCGEQLRMSLDNRRGTDSAASLLGTVFHEAIAEPKTLMQYGSTLKYWRDLFTRIRSERERDYSLFGRVMVDQDYDWLAGQMHSGERIGVSAQFLTTMVLSELSIVGWSVTRSELFLEWVDIGEPGEEGYGEYPISWVGTIDMMIKNPEQGTLGIADVKTSGLWGPILKRRGESGRSTVTQKWTPEMIAHHRQLRHYDWLSMKVSGVRADQYGLIHPANLVPYKTGPKKGHARGTSLNLGPVLKGGHLEQYEEDLKRQMSIWSLPWGLGRDYPEIYGKSECPRCRYFTHCMGKDQ